MKKLSVVIISVLLVFGLSVSTSAKLIYVTNAGNNTVSIIDTSKNEVVNTIRVGVWPAGIAIDPTTNRAYVVNSNEAESSVSVVDLSSNSTLAKV